MDLEIVRSNLISEIENRLMIIAGGYSIIECSPILDELSRYFQGLAICYLLTQNDVSKYQENLVRSGQSRDYFLKRSKIEGNTNDRRLALSRTEAIFDLVAAAQLGYANRLAIESNIAWNRSWEYEDDYLYFSFINILVKNYHNPDTNQLQELINKFEVVIGGKGCVRIDICKSFVEQDVDKFEQSLMMLIDELIERNNSARERMTDSIIFWPRNFISIEALALIQLAKLLGLRIEYPIPMCPEVAILPVEEKEFLNLYDEMESTLGLNR